MIAALVVVFRESLEASLIVSIVMAASRGIEGRGRAIGFGLMAGLAGAALLAAFAGKISSMAGGMGNEYLKATALILAVIMIGWHHVWMGKHGSELTGQTRAVGKEVQEGVKPLSALAMICAIAVLREGSETVLFLYGIAAEGTAGGMLEGGLLGGAAATFLGILLYFGLLRIPMKHVFKITGLLLVLIAAGLSAQAASLLVQAGLLPSIGYDIWNTSKILPQDSALGLLLHVLVGYDDRPMGIQVVVYVATLAFILTPSFWVGGRQEDRTARSG
ncbi:MAG: iron permease [Rhizobiales bacterium 65-79]|nr:FTR1 family protein [Hyphomicrobiales bacterium]OJU04802.1 MAG: iron permease [Rhizobiales bacterium 65-79]